MEYNKEDLQKLWGRKDKVIFPSYETVTAVALEKLFDKLPQKFFKKVDNAPQKSKYRKKTKSDPKVDVCFEATRLNYQSKDNERSEVLSQYVEQKDRLGECFKRNCNRLQNQLQFQRNWVRYCNQFSDQLQ